METKIIYVLNLLFSVIFYFFFPEGFLPGFFPPSSESSFMISSGVIFSHSILFIKDYMLRK